MNKLFGKRSSKVGLPPGTLVHIGEKRAGFINISLIEYSEEWHREERVQYPDMVEISGTGVKWINVDGVHNKDVIKMLGNRFNIHSLVQEDIMHTGLRPKLDIYDNYLFITLNMLYFDTKEEEILSEQVSLVFTRDLVLSFQEKPGDVFDLIRERIRNNKGLVRKKGEDYLVYAFIDAIVDNYFLVLEKIGEKVEELEQRIINSPEEADLNKIQFYKKELIFLRKSVWPLREIIGSLIKDENSFFHKDTIYYLRDVYDHLFEIIDIVELFREMLTGLIDIYLSSTSNRMNEVMKVLTVISTIFIPMTFLAGLYGMNFKYMPELEFSWGYPMVLVIMLLIAVIMLVYFKRKNWF